MHANAILEYASTYHDLLLDLRNRIEHGTDDAQREALAFLKSVLATDLIHVQITDFRGKTKEASIVSPTHPLRALWLATWAHVTREWVVALEKGPSEYIAPVREAALQSLVPINMPAALPLPDGRVFATVDNLNPFWSLYAATTEEDTRGLVSEICSSLGLPEPAIGGSTVTGDLLASRIQRYLVQHPYVRTLRINAFNPGRATVLADTLVFLQKQEAFTRLRYDIHLFVPDPEASGVGEALEELASPANTVSTEAADVFSTSTNSHLFPKLSLAIHDTQEFHLHPEKYRANITVLLDLFPAEEIGAEEPFRREIAAPIHGLLQGFNSSFSDDGSRTLWRKQPRHGEAQTVLGADELTYLLAELPKTLSGATATIAKELPSFTQRPVITLSLDVEQRSLIHEVHEVSDWVYTVDRNMGIEFFDHGRTGERPDYLIDYTPSANVGSGHKVVITSRSTSELEAMVGPVLEAHGLEVGRRHATLVLDQLRYLSGRLALKLISSTTQQMEALGLALARLFLDYQGALSNQIVQPLDAHLELFRSIKQQKEEIGEATSLQRTDLALFDLDGTTRVIRCNLVEVKCYTKVGGVGSYSQLKEQIAQQIRQSEDVLRRHFDPEWKSPDRPDRLLKTQELVALLQFYLDRAVRHSTIDRDAADDATALLDTLESGYRMEFTHSAFIFDFEKPGAELAEREDGIAYYRIGIDLIRSLLDVSE